MPPPGWMPTSRKRGSKRALGEHSTTSHASATLPPAPTAGPFTAATVGSGQLAIDSKPPYMWRRGARGLSRSSTDPPEQNTGGVAVTTSAPIPMRITWTRIQKTSRSPLPMSLAMSHVMMPAFSDCG